MSVCVYTKKQDLKEFDLKMSEATFLRKPRRLFQKMTSGQHQALCVGLAAELHVRRVAAADDRIAAVRSGQRSVAPVGRWAKLTPSRLNFQTFFGLVFPTKND